MTAGLIEKLAWDPTRIRKIRKWRGPMTAGLIEKLAWDPTRIRKLESGGVR